jgi:hypothetical protein
MRTLVLACLIAVARPAIADDAKRLASMEAAKKLVGGWSRFALEVVDTPDDHEKPYYQPFELAIGDGAIAWAKMRMKLPGKRAWYPLEGFAILRKGEIVALVYGS